MTLPTRGQYIHKGGEFGSRVHGTQDSAIGLTLSTHWPTLRYQRHLRAGTLTSFLTPVCFVLHPQKTTLLSSSTPVVWNNCRHHIPPLSWQEALTLIVCVTRIVPPSSLSPWVDQGQYDAIPEATAGASWAPYPGPGSQPLTRILCWLGIACSQGAAAGREAVLTGFCIRLLLLVLRQSHI